VILLAQYFRFDWANLGNRFKGSLSHSSFSGLFGDQRKSVLHDIALFTGGKTTTKGIEIQLSGMQISDLGQAWRITVDNGHTCIATLKSRDPLQRMPMSLVAIACVPPELDS
jgi:chaperonin GroEL (HSP60 family)